MQETWVWSLNWEDPLEKGMATYSSILVWRIPWGESPGGLVLLKSSWIFCLYRCSGYQLFGIIFCIYYMPGLILVVFTHSLYFLFYQLLTFFLFFSLSLSFFFLLLSCLYLLLSLIAFKSKYFGTLSHSQKNWAECTEFPNTLFWHIHTSRVPI